MILKYLLDTNILSSIVREPFGKTALKAVARGRDRICTSIMVAGEIWHGVEKTGATKLRQDVAAALAYVPILELKPPAELFYAKIRTSLQRAGTPIGGNDMWIAAHAMAEGLTLITDDEADFSRIEGLAIENWLR